MRIRDDFVGVAFVHDGQGHTQQLRAGDEVPQWASVGDHLLSADADAASASEYSAAAEVDEPLGDAAEPNVEEETAAADEDDVDKPAEELDDAIAVEAPKGNGSREEWAAYADSLGVAYDVDAKRDEIRALVEAHLQG